MKVITCETGDRLSERAAGLVLADVEQKPGLLLCPATGNSPTGLYDRLAREDRSRFNSLRLIELDEWGGVPATAPGSATRYLYERVLDPLGIARDRLIAFDTSAAPETACGRMRATLEQIGPIDLCILGLGKNGHIGFIEPGAALVPHCHVARLTEETRRHAMTRSMASPPSFGLTLGMKEILGARHIILLVTGEGKAEATGRLLSGEVSTMLPASLLWLHGNVECLVEEGLRPT